MGDSCHFQDAIQTASQLTATDNSYLDPLAVKVATLSASIPGAPLLFGRGCRYIHQDICDIDANFVSSYLRRTLNVDTLNALHRHLWWAGRPGNIRPLHQQAALNRNIVASERSFLHLLWYQDKIYIKPLPAYLLSATFFAEYIDNSPDPELRRLALGFLRSYAYLIQYPIDLKLAKEKFLVPEDLEWYTWSDLAAHILRVPDSEINKRYYYGELRLSRINQTHTYCYSFPTPYYTEHTSLIEYFSNGEGVLVTLIISVLLMAILAAQQVLLTTNKDVVPWGRYAIEQSSWWFSVLSLVALAVSIGSTIIMFAMSFMYHMVRQIFN